MSGARVTLGLGVLGGTAVGALALLGGMPSPAEAQELRGWLTSTVRYVEARPLREDTIPLERLTLRDDGVVLVDGEPSGCTSIERCILYLPVDVESATVGTQDLGFTAWGFGVEGLSFTALLRGRARLGGDFVWPRSDDEVDLFLGYAELQREGWRVRLGRQRTLSGLGFTGYDGASAALEPVGGVRVEAYGGRSLARGVAEPRDEALRSPENFIRDEEAYLVGAFLQARLPGATEVGLRYQREIWADRAGLISERASFDLRTDVVAPLRIRGSVDWDFAFGHVGKAELELQRAFRTADGVPGVAVSVLARRYVPYFELSTVWGFFSPAAYHEVLGRVAWSGDGTTAWGEGGWRTYEDAETAVVFSPLEEDGWRAEAGVSRRLDAQWSVEGRYELEWGVGAFLNAGDLRLRFEPNDRIEVGLHGTSFQRIEEFRLGDGRVYGGGVDLGVRISGSLRLDGGAALYRHDAEDGPGDDVWSQTRLWSALRWDFGADPGQPRPRLRR